MQQQTAPAPARRDRQGALAWLAFLAVAVIGVAAAISGAIRHGLGPQGPAGASPGAAERPSPAPPPLPRPRAAPIGRAP